MANRQSGLPTSSAVTPNGRAGDGNDTRSRWHPYPTFTSSDETRGKTESPNTGQANRASSTQRDMIDTLRKMP